MKYQLRALSEPSITNLADLALRADGRFEARVALLDQDGRASDSLYFTGLLTKAELDALKALVAPYLPPVDTKTFVDLDPAVLAAAKPVAVEAPKEPDVDDEPIPTEEP